MMMTNNEIEQISNTIFIKYVIRGGSYKQFSKIMKEEDIKFREISFSNIKFLGALTFGSKNSQPYIMINKDIPNMGRRNFTIAHELGHFFLNHKSQSSSFECYEDDITEDKQATKNIEHEANHFASCFLMPEQKITSAFLGMLKNSKKATNKKFLNVKKENYGVWRKICNDLTKRYGVSEAALRYRLRYLKLAQFDFD
jgi:Zn-dependent peptidase ImmA (M78 family)